MGYNLVELHKKKDKINVNLAASGVAFKERYNSVVADAIAREQPQALQSYFQERVTFIEHEANTILAYLLSRNKYRASILKKEINIYVYLFFIFK